MIFSAITILSFFVCLFYWANNRAINQMNNEMRRLREQIRALIAHNGNTPDVFSADEIKNGISSCRISPAAKFISLDEKTENNLLKNSSRFMLPVRTPPHPPPASKAPHLSPDESAILQEFEEKAENEKIFSKGNRQPITEILSDIYDDKKKNKRKYKCPK